MEILSHGESPNRNGTRRFPRALVVILALGCAVRLALGVWCADRLLAEDDEREYHILAVNLAEHGEFAFKAGQPTSLRPPLYPTVVAGCYSLFGPDSRPAIWALQSLLSLGTVLVVYQIGVEAFSQRIGLWAAALTAFYPSLLAYNVRLLTEVQFTFLLCLSCWAVLRGLRRQSLLACGCTGVLLGLAALTRSVVWLFPPVLALFWLSAGPGGFGQRLTAAALMCVTFAATIVPWTIRNTLLQKTLVTIDVMGGRNFMMGNYAHTPLFRAWDAISIQGEQAWDHVLRAETAVPVGITQGKFDKLALQSGLRFVRENPGLTLQRDAIKFCNFWQLEREVISGAAHGYFGPLSKLTLLALAALVSLGYAGAMFSGIFGLICRPPADWRVHGFFLLLMAYVCGMHTLVFGHSRYHLPLMPLVLLFSAAALTQVGHILSTWRTLRFSLAALGCVLLAASWAYDIFWVDPQRYFGSL